MVFCLTSIFAVKACPRGRKGICDHVEQVTMEPQSRYREGEGSQVLVLASQTPKSLSSLSSLSPLSSLSRTVNSSAEPAQH